MKVFKIQAIQMKIYDLNKQMHDDFGNKDKLSKQIKEHLELKT